MEKYISSMHYETVNPRAHFCIMILLMFDCHCISLLHPSSLFFLKYTHEQVCLAS